MPANGGFPPINYCPKKLEVKFDKDNKIQKERFFNPKISTNVNIRKILKESSVKPIIDLNDKKEDLDIVTDF
jgi:hypothetical protein